MIALACMISPAGPLARIVEIGRAIEGAGARRIWIPDEGLHGREVHVTLAALAGATERVELGPGITNPYTRHPGVTASAVATLDELSNGRAVLGVGAGGGLALGPLGIARRTPIRRVEQLVGACRTLWAGRVLDSPDGAEAAGEAEPAGGAAGGRPAGSGPPEWAFRRARLEGARPDISIWVGGRGPRITELAGRVADGFMLSYVHRDLIGEHVAAIRAAAAHAGRPRPRLAMMTAVVADDAALAEARTALTFRLADSPSSVHERIGLDRGALAALRSALGAGGPPEAAHLVRDEWVEQFTLMGEVDGCARQLRAVAAEHGIDEFQLSIGDLGRAETTIAIGAAVVAAASQPAL